MHDRNRRALGLVPAMAAAMLLAVSVPATADHGLHITDLSDPALDAPALATSLAGTGVTVDAASVVYTGVDESAGAFTGGEPVVGFDEGIILSSGWATDAVGPNDAGNTSRNLGTAGDADLSALSGFGTFDATILEFDFTAAADADQVFFDYVFGSEEYNEYVGSSFNDVFAFWVNGTNCAVVGDPPVPVTVNTINNGSNSSLYVDNTAGAHNTEMDGFTVPLTCEADVQAGETNTLRLAIADSSDRILDSWVFIEAGSLTTVPPEPEPEPECVDLIAAQNIDVGEVCVSNDDTNLYVTYTAVDGWMLTETHLAVGDEEADLPQTKKGNPIPGQFAYQAVHDPATDTFTYTIPLADIADDDGELAIGAHAVVEKAHVILESGYYGDTVLAAEQGDRKDGTDVLAERSDPSNALVPDSETETNFFSLGFGGSIDISFACPVYNGDGDDLRLWEVTNATYPAEIAEVYAWDDAAADWVLLGTADNSGQSSASRLTESSFDLGGLQSASQFRIMDVSDPTIHNNEADGFDLDGIEALQDCIEVQEETAWGDGSPFVEQGNWGMYFTYQLTD